MGSRSHTPKGAASRGKIVRAAEVLLAARGFHGTSFRDVAVAARLPLASVVYHFARKEQLYAAVLGEIAAPMIADIEAVVGRGGDYAERLDEIVRDLVRWAEKYPGRVKLLVRELLDNPARVANAAKLPLAPVLLGLSAFVDEGVAAGVFRVGVPEIGVLHLVGAVSYFVAAGPTLRRIVGSARDAQIRRAYEREAIAFARRTFLAAPAAPLVPTARARAQAVPPLTAKEVSRHASRDPGRARPPRARARRTEDDRP